MKNSYEIDGNLYVFNNARLKSIIKSRNPNRGALEQFYRRVVSKDVGIAYDTVKGWVKNDTNPAIEDVKVLAEILEIPYMQLLDCTHYSADAVHTKLQKISFTEVLDSFSLRYDGFSNVLDMIIGMGYNPETQESRCSDFAERIINILGIDETEKHELPELLGYSFIYSEDELRNMQEKEFGDALNSAYIDGEGNSFFNKDSKIAIDRIKFGERLIKNTPWLDKEDSEELQAVIEEAETWWNYCEMPFALLKIDINAFGYHLARFTYGPGWTQPTHTDRWALILDILNVLGTRVDVTGLLGINEMHIDQFEGEMFFTIEAFKHY